MTPEHKYDTNTRVVKCPVCEIESRFLPLKVGVDIFRCPSCDHCFTDVSVMEAHEPYDEDYFLVRHPNWFNNPNYKLFDYISKALNGLASGPKILDVGCGKGDLLRYLHKHNPKLKLSGIDFTKNQPTPEIEFHCGDVFELAESHTFDAIVSLAVIEHIEDVSKFINKLQRLLNPNGIVILMTVDERSLLYSLSRLFGKLTYWGPATRLYERHHLNHFNRSSLRRLMELNRLTVIEARDHVIPIAAVDFDSSSRFNAAILKLGVRVIFTLARLIHRSHTQTIICNKG